MPDLFDELSQLLADQGVDAALEHLAQRLVADAAWHDLFDLRLMQARRREGLPLVLDRNWEELPSEQRQPLEEAYLEACREIGNRFLSSGALREAWVYFRPTGDVEAMADSLSNMAINEDNLHDVVELSLHEGAAPLHGFALVLEHYGVCNAITAFESVMRTRSPQMQQKAARMLLRRVYDDLIENVRGDIERRNLSPAAGAALGELVAAHPEVFEGGAYHLDVTHLAATVRAAQLLTDEESLHLACDLTEYGRRLDEQYQFEGEEPFADVYPSHALFFRAQLGEEVDAALAFFRTKSEEFSPENYGPGPLEAYITLLDRTGRAAEAMRLVAEALPPARQGAGGVPTLWDVARRHDRFDLLQAAARKQNKPLDYLAAVAARVKPS